MTNQHARRTIAVMAIGAQSALAQLVVMRAGLERFGGNEFFIGITLCAWLVIGALGAGLLGRLADKNGVRVGLIRGGILSVSVGVLLAIVILHVISVRLSPPGMAASPLAAIGWIALAAAPASIAAGALFAWLVPAFHRDFGPSLGITTLLESLGAAVGGFLFGSLILDVIGTPGLVATVVITGAVAVLAMVPPTGRTTRAALLAVMLALAAAGAWLAWTVVPTTPGMRITERLENRFGRFVAVENDGQTTIVNAGRTVVDCDDRQTPELLAAVIQAFAPVSAGPDATAAVRDVLVLGRNSRDLGPMAVLPGSRLNFVTQNQALEDLVQRRCHQPQLKDVDQIFMDPVEAMTGRTARSDVIVLRPGVPDTLSHARLVTDRSFRQIATLLKPGGRLFVTFGAADAYPTEAETRLLAGLLNTASEHFRNCRVLPIGSWWLVCGDSDVNLDAVKASLSNYPGERLYATDTFFADALDPMSLNRLTERIERVRPDTATNRLTAPSAQFHALLNWAGRSYPSVGTWVGLPSGLPSYLRSDLPSGLPSHSPSEAVAGSRPLNRLNPLFPVLAAVPVLILILGRTRRLRRPHAWTWTTAALTGAVGITVELALMATVESAYGTLFHWLGGMIAAYMAGLGIGAFAAWLLTRDRTVGIHGDNGAENELNQTDRAARLARLTRITMVGLALTVGLAALVCVGMTTVLPRLAGIPLAMLVLALCAALSGAAFQLATERLRTLSTEGSGQLTGLVRGIDAAVSGIAALSAALIFLPLAGTTAVLVSCAMACVALAESNPNHM